MIFGCTLWSRVIQSKYIKQDITSWLRCPQKRTHNVSLIWSGFLRIYDWLAMDLTWKAGTGNDILIGIDPILGLGTEYRLPDEICRSLHNAGYITLNHIRNLDHRLCQSYWLLASALGFAGTKAQVWTQYTQLLNESGCRLTSERDMVIWQKNKAMGTVTARLAYHEIISTSCIYPGEWWYGDLWN